MKHDTQTHIHTLHHYAESVFSGMPPIFKALGQRCQLDHETGHHNTLILITLKHNTQNTHSYYTNTLSKHSLAPHKCSGHYDRDACFNAFTVSNQLSFWRIHARWLFLLKFVFFCEMRSWLLLTLIINICKTICNKIWNCNSHLWKVFL